jgi:Cys-rich four helix bundle protein (predicted Tat secretion target)
MERRDFITAVGATAAIASVSQALANEHEKHPAAAGEHHHPPKYKALTDASGKCVIEGDNCLRHCFGMLSMNDASMADCTKLTYETIAACKALESLSAVNSSFTLAMAKIVAGICEACKKECDKFPQYVECRDMSTACKTCATECLKIV